ncbi:crotonase/enoyl-CoA hydratase family protein [Bradyrhizobium sp. ma5]|uniref:crotonase/enoyl-CoA hydratase family protein n=1 Tax=Bradyrhizobium sp. ma5 TaxID=3344828 RepID=UPI0035D51E77
MSNKKDEGVLMVTGEASSLILHERDGGIVTLTLNEPKTRNALSSSMIDAIIQHCERINADMGVRCVLLAATGSSFSSGGNIKDMHAQTGAFSGQSPAEFRQQVRGTIQRLQTAIYALEVPVIAAVNGHAIGAGCDLSLMCDIRIAADDAMFAESFLRLGLVPADGGAWFLPRIVGLSRAYEMMFTGEMIRASEAAAMGLVSKVVPRQTLLAEARALAGRIADKPPQALRLTKRLIRDSMRLTLSESAELAATMQAIAQSTADHKEALSAFLDKRGPAFQGR